MNGPRPFTLRVPGLPPLRVEPGVLIVPMLATFPLWWGLRGNGTATAAIVVPGLVLSMLAHELGHALVARRLGWRVRRIELNVAGGAAVLDGSAVRPEPAITWAGPLVNLVLGLALLLAAAMLPEAGPVAPGPWSVPPPATEGLGRRVLLWLGWGNLLLGLVNLLPAYSLDGGYLLHEAIRRRAGLRRALRVVGLCGMTLSVLRWVAFAASLAAGVPLMLPPDLEPNRRAWRLGAKRPPAPG
jgi:Zn-dependent protease